MNNQITYDDKVALNDNPLIPDINKCKADDMNEIKSKHNGCMNGSIPMGNIVVDSIKTKNLIPVEEQFSVITSQSIYVNIPAGTYTISGKITGDSNYYSLIVFNKNGTELTSVSLNHSGNLSQSTFTLTNEIDEIILYSNSTWATSNGQTSTFNELQLEKGTTATSYSPYQNLNGYDIYSTSEIKIGTWINGKNLYRKVYNFGQLPNATVKGMALNISNLDEIISIRGICKNETADYTTVIPQVDTTNVSTQLQVYVQDNEVKVYTAGNKSAYTKSYIVIEYTKTTD